MVGGNVYGEMTILQEDGFNSIGERVNSWILYTTLFGWLDLMSGDSQYINNAKMQESTHVFICDFVPIDRKAENKRLSVNGQEFDVLLIDNPMELNQHLEIYLKKVI